MRTISSVAYDWLKYEPWCIISNHDSRVIKIRTMLNDAKPFLLKILLHLEEQAVEGYTQLKSEYYVANEMLKTLLELNVRGKSL